MLELCPMEKLVVIPFFRGPRLLIGAGADWFQVGDTPAVSLQRRVTLRRLLLALVELRATPNAVLSVTEAFEKGWPGERAKGKAAALRVYTAMHTLRRFGLRDLIVRAGEGYTLLGEVHLEEHARLAS